MSPWLQHGNKGSQTSVPTPSDSFPLGTGLFHFPQLPLETKCSNTAAYGGQFAFKQQHLIKLSSEVICYSFYLCPLYWIQILHDLVVVTIYLCRCYSYYLPITSLLRVFSNRNISRNEESNNLDVCFVIELEFNQIKMTLGFIFKNQMKQTSL